MRRRWKRRPVPIGEGIPEQAPHHGRLTPPASSDHGCGLEFSEFGSTTARVWVRDVGVAGMLRPIAQRGGSRVRVIPRGAHRQRDD